MIPLPRPSVNDWDLHTKPHCNQKDVKVISAKSVGQENAADVDRCTDKYVQAVETMYPSSNVHAGKIKPVVVNSESAVSSESIQQVESRPFTSSLSSSSTSSSEKDSLPINTATNNEAHSTTSFSEIVSLSANTAPNNDTKSFSASTNDAPIKDSQVILCNSELIEEELGWQRVAQRSSLRLRKQTGLLEKTHPEYPTVENGILLTNIDHKHKEHSDVPDFVKKAQQIKQKWVGKVDGNGFLIRKKNVPEHNDYYQPELPAVRKVTKLNSIEPINSQALSAFSRESFCSESSKSSTTSDSSDHSKCSKSSESSNSSATSKSSKSSEMSDGLDKSASEISVSMKSLDISQEQHTVRESSEKSSVSLDSHRDESTINEWMRKSARMQTALLPQIDFEKLELKREALQKIRESHKNSGGLLASLTNVPQRNFQTETKKKSVYSSFAAAPLQVRDSWLQKSENSIPVLNVTCKRESDSQVLVTDSAVLENLRGELDRKNALANDN